MNKNIIEKKLRLYENFDKTSCYKYFLGADITEIIHDIMGSNVEKAYVIYMEIESDKQYYNKNCKYPKTIKLNKNFIEGEIYIKFDKEHVCKIGGSENVWLKKENS